MHKNNEVTPAEYAANTMFEALADHTCFAGTVDLQAAAPGVEIAQAKLQELGFGEEAIGRAFVRALENIQAFRQAVPENFYA